MTTNPLVDEYAEKIKPLLPLAKRAYGSRDQDTPQHEASREYTRLLTEFKDKGGNLQQLAGAIGTTYSGMRRRVVMRDVSVPSVRRTTPVRSKTSPEALEAAVARVRAAKEVGTEAYHDQLAAEYEAGIPLSGIAKALGVSSAAPLYYGISRSIQRKTTV